VSLKHTMTDHNYNITKIDPPNSVPPTQNPLTSAISNLSLMGTKSNSKFIPTVYKKASVSQKIRLLQGLLDTDGTVSKKGSISYTTVSKQLADDIREMVWSIGGTCSMSFRYPTFTYNGTKKRGQLAYYLGIGYKTPIELFSLPRKKALCIEQHGEGRIQLRRRIKNIQYHSTEPAQCIAVSSPDQLYVTDDYIVTHNTFMTAAICEAYGRCGYRTLTIVPNDVLLQQTKADYINCGIHTGVYSGTHKILDPSHVVSTWQALKNNPKIVRLFQVIVVDECHVAKGAVLQKLLIEHCADAPFRFGVTGTMPKEPADSMAVLCALGPIKHKMPAKTLMDMGILAKLHIDVVQLEENLQKEYTEYCDEVAIQTPLSYRNFKESYFPDYSAEKEYLRHNTIRTGWIAALIESKRNDEKGNVLCLVDSIPFGRQLAALIPNAIFVNGKDMKTTKEKQEVYNLFKQQDNLVVIATVNIAGTGLSIRRIFHLITVDIGKSFVRVIQGIGRALRIADDKDCVTMADVCSDLKYSKAHLAQRISYFKEAQYDYKLHKISYDKHKNTNIIT